MNVYEEGLQVMEKLFAKDCAFALATAAAGAPDVRMVDVFYDDGSFYIVTHENSAKARQIAETPAVSFCAQCFRFYGEAKSVGHPLKPENAGIRAKLVRAFAPWYFRHNDENDEGMCYLRAELKKGFFYCDGTGYDMNFADKTAQSFPFVFDILTPVNG